MEMLQTKLVLTGGARTQVPHDRLPCVEVLTDTQHKLRDVRVSVRSGGPAQLTS